MADELLEMAKKITEQEATIKKYKDAYESACSSRDNARTERDAAREEVRRLEKQLQQAAPDTVKMLTEAHMTILAENAELHERLDEVYAGHGIDVAAKERFRKAIIERLKGIEILVKVAMNET